MENMAVIMDAKREGRREGLAIYKYDKLYDSVRNGSISLTAAAKEVGVREEELIGMSPIMDALRDGRREGEERMCKLINSLAQQGAMDEILRVTSDEMYRDQMIKNLNLI